jgi:triosephosphate isomerase
MSTRLAQQRFQTFGLNGRRPSRRLIVGAGFKMYLDFQQTLAWARAIRQRHTALAGVGVFVLPTFPALRGVSGLLAGTRILLGAQDTHWEERGAYTGEVSPVVLRELGCTFVEIGHTERRALFGETDATVQRKTQAVLKQGMVPLVCVGEPADAGVEAAIRHTRCQLRAALEGCGNFGVNRSPLHAGPAVVVAYEPAWAIGAEASAPADHIGPVVAALRQELGDLWPGQSAVLYGGSVTCEAIGPVLAADVDGLFVGRASLDPAAFLDIVQSARRLFDPATVEAAGREV